MTRGTDEGRGCPDSRGVMHRPRVGGGGRKGRPWRGVWEVSEEKPFRGLLQQNEWSPSPPPAFPHMEAILGGQVGVESMHTTRTRALCC